MNTTLDVREFSYYNNFNSEATINTITKKKKKHI